MTASLQIAPPSSPPNNEPGSETLALQTPKIQNQYKDDLSRFVPIAITTDTMAPTLNAGDVVFVDCADIRLNNCGLFAFSLPPGPLLADGYQTVKRVDQRLGGMVCLMHDNKSYEDIYINPNDPQEGEFQVIGRVVWTACRV